MSTPRSRASRVFTISFPENLAQQVEQVAEDESRTISELFRQAFRAYLADRALRSLEKTRAEVNARHSTPYTEDDVYRLVREVRAELAMEKENAKQKATV